MRTVGALDFVAPAANRRPTQAGNLVHQLNPAVELLRSQHAAKAPPTLLVQPGDDAIDGLVIFGRRTVWVLLALRTLTMVDRSRFHYRHLAHRLS